MEAHIIEWLNLSIRWIHMITGIAWIGASFYFNFLENNLNRTLNLRDELAGNLWAIHGGGFYYLEKYKHSPAQIPKKLHWFKWEAYFTLLSGLSLLTLIYYYNAELYMLDATVATISANQAIGIGFSSLLIGWIVYDGLCKSALIKHMRFFALLGFVLIVLMAFALSQVLSGRAAYIHIGALIGTIMVLNVFFVIIPAQKSMLSTALKGQPADQTLGKKALMRSTHNNYMTLPVLFVMISQHFPSTFGHQYSWLVLSVLIIIGVTVRHWFNLKGKGIKNVWLLPTSMVLLIALVMYTMPQISQNTESANNTHTVMTDLHAMHIIEKHCISCHSVHPSSQIFATAPKGLMLDSFAAIVKNATLIKQQVVNSQIMPLGNSTNMQEAERADLGLWLDKLQQQ